MDTENLDCWSKFEHLVTSIGIGLLTTHRRDGSLHTRPLQTLRVTREALWFFTDRDSAKADEVREESRVSVAYADVAGHRYAAVSGIGRVRVDGPLARALWKIDQKGYYPQGPEDPQLAVLEVAIERAEYWLAPGRTAYYLAALRATLTGQGVKTIGEDHQL